MVKIQDPPDPPDPEPEVTGVPGHVQKMISLFSSPDASDNKQNGSEPSLASRTLVTSGGSSVSASKRTLVSQENITGTGGSVDTLDTAYRSHSSDSSHGQLRERSHDRSCDSLDTVEASKSPSYVKLSCAVSGYNKYSSYNQTPPPIRSTDTDQENIIPNGNVDQVKGQKLSSNLGQVKGLKPGRVVPVGQKPVPPKKPLPLQSTKCVRNSDSSDYTLTNGAISHTDSHTASHAPADLFVAKATEASTTTSSTDPLVSSPGVDSVLPNEDSASLTNGLDVTDHSVILNHKNRSSDTSADHRLIHVNSSHPEQDVLSTPKNAPKEEDSRSDGDDIPTPQKDGKYFLSVVERETNRLQSLCGQAEQDLNTDLPEEASGKVRAAIGKANLLTSKKFKQFRGLCQQNIDQSEEDPFQTTAQDLAGFWDMVLTQVDDLNSKFEEIDTLRNNGWMSKNMSNSNLSAMAHKSAASKHTGVRPKSSRSKASSSISSTPKSSKSSEASRQREEARRRLLEAKRAGRQRKVSQSDKEEVEIFVPQ